THGAALLAAARNAKPEELEVAVRAVGLAGGITVEDLAAWRAAADPALALTAHLATLRLTNRDAILGELGDAVRDSGPTGRAAVDELCVEIARSMEAGDGDRTLEAARHLTRALKRGRGDVPGRTAAFVALARVVAWARAQRSAELSLLRAD